MALDGKRVVARGLIAAAVSVHLSVFNLLLDRPGIGGMYVDGALVVARALIVAAGRGAGAGARFVIINRLLDYPGIDGMRVDGELVIARALIDATKNLGSKEGRPEASRASLSRIIDVLLGRPGVDDMELEGGYVLSKVRNIALWQGDMRLAARIQLRILASTASGLCSRRAR